MLFGALEYSECIKIYDDSQIDSDGIGGGETGKGQCWPRMDRKTQAIKGIGMIKSRSTDAPSAVRRWSAFARGWRGPGG